MVGVDSNVSMLGRQDWISRVHGKAMMMSAREGEYRAGDVFWIVRRG